MASNNTSISVTVYNNINAIIVGATIVVSIAGQLFNLTTDNTGTATATLNLSNITVASFVISAPGFINLSFTQTISPAANNITKVLAIDQTQINKILTVANSSNAVVSGCKVYINGISIGTTDSNGDVQVVAPAGATTLQITNSNYQTYNLSGVYTASTFPNKVIIFPLVITGQIIQVQTLPGANILINGNDTIVADSNGLGTSNNTYVPGTYSVVVSKTNYNNLTTSIIVKSGITTYSVGSLTPSYTPGAITQAPGSISSLNSQTVSSPSSYSLGPKRFGSTLGGDDSTTPGATAITPSASTPINVGGTSEADYPSEWIYPNSGDGKYLTGSQARIYIGNLFIDEVDTLYYVYNNNRIPVYGYSSANVDAFGQGRRIVQGQLSVNYVSEGYLYTVLSEYHKTSSTTSGQTTAQQQSQQASDNLANLYSQKQTLLSQQANGSTDPSLNNQLTLISNQIISAVGKMGPGSVAQAKQTLSDSTTAKSTSNAIRRNVPFDVIIKASGGGRTTTRTLSNCLLTSNEQVWDNSDNSMKDVYGFIGTELV